MLPTSCENLALTRSTLENAMRDWTKDNEGPIGLEYVTLLLSNGEVLEVLERVTGSMRSKQTTFTDNNSCLIWTAYMNMKEFGSPGFPIFSENT